jgi:multidrug efflux system outer membrane protein
MNQENHRVKTLSVRTLKLIPIAGAALALLAGCVHVPPDTRHAAGPDFAKAAVAPGIVLPNDAWPAEDWWRVYGDAQLDALVERALRDAPSLAVAQARVGTAQASVVSERVAQGGRIDLASGVNRQRYSSNGFFPPPLGGAYYNDFSVQARASYDFDWWGKHRSLVAAALGEANASQAEAAQAKQTLAASVAQSYFRLQMLWARRDNVNGLIAVQKALIADREARMVHGLVNQDAVQAARLDLGTLSEQAGRYGTQAAAEREALRALIGGDSGALTNLKPVLPQPAANTLPHALGLELLARRPDLQAARYRVEAQLGRVAAGEAAFYPDINLMAVIGLDSVSLGSLARYPSRTPLLGATLNLPLFDAGRLKAQLGIARASRDELLAEYNGAVLDAVRDVAVQGATLQGLAVEQDTHATAVDASGRLAANAEARLQHGLADRADVLLARQTMLRQRDTDLVLLDARLQAQVSLAKALGGGYRAPEQNADARQTASNPTPTTHAKP